jgi:hypothetical protein
MNWGIFIIECKAGYQWLCHNSAKALEHAPMLPIVAWVYQLSKIWHQIRMHRALHSFRQEYQQ